VPTILKQGSNQGIRFLVYDDVSKILKNNGLGTIPSNFFAGAVAGAASVVANTPVDVVKTVMQGLDAQKYKGTWDCTVQIVKN
jgi:solute carrier family 25 (mitochondrial citrate transporter), member 1